MRALFRFRFITFALAFTTLILSYGSGQESTGNSETPAYLNPKLSVEQRADDLVARMTLKEKASQVVHLSAAIPRLQVPAYNWWSEALHGVAYVKATVFPEPIGLGATFDPVLMHDIAAAIGAEARALHNEDVSRGDYTGIGLDFWAPNINIFRDPRWGRGQETYGEDPFLTARMGVAFVTGMQGDDRRYYRVIATPKHFAVHSGPEPARHSMDVVVSRHDEEDTYLPAFRATVIEGHAGSVMCAYNRVNGEPACANTFLLQDQLRQAWNFGGYVVSDCGAVQDIQAGHHTVATLPRAAAIAVKHSMDLECSGSDYSHYVAAVKNGFLKESDLDVAVKRLMRARIRMGMFDPPSMVKYAQISSAEIDSEAHRELALRAARESIVLLKNDGLLPLKAQPGKIAVIGPLADSVRVLLGNYNGTPTRSTTVLEGIQKQFPQSQVSFAAGTAFLRVNIPVPNSALSMSDGKAGVKYELFRGTNFHGEPVEAHSMDQVYMNYTNPDYTAASARFSGFLTAEESGKYKVSVTGDGVYRMWLDDKRVITGGHLNAVSTTTGDLSLEKGRKYSLKLEFLHNGGPLVTKLMWTLPGDTSLDAAVQAVKAADVVIAGVGLNSDLEREEGDIHLPGFDRGDRTSIDLPKEEEDLLKAVNAAGKPLIVVLMSGSALAVNWASQNANALLEAWYPGEEGGTAVAETLAGVNNPAGRLPVTFYKSTDQLPPFEDYSMAKRTYRYFEGQPLYAFGYGLSYSQFAYSNLRLASSTLKAGEALTVDVDVRNTSKLDGDEVGQLYLAFPPIPGAPLRALRGFTRVHVPAAATEHLHFKLDPRDLSLVNEAGARVVAPGEYRVSVGGGQPGAASEVNGNFSIVGEVKLPE